MDFVEFRVLFGLIENPLHDCRVLVAGDNFRDAAALIARFDIEYPFEALNLG